MEDDPVSTNGPLDLAKVSNPHPSYPEVDTLAQSFWWWSSHTRKQHVMLTTDLSSESLLNTEHLP